MVRQGLELTRYTTLWWISAYELMSRRKNDSNIDCGIFTVQNSLGERLCRAERSLAMITLPYNSYVAK